MVKEYHTMRLFRNTGLGKIRLNNLAIPEQEKMIITIGGKRIYPISFDTYGHPIIGANNFKYYKALKSNYDRKNETFLLEVSYEPRPFCIKRESFDDIEAIREAILSAEDGSLKKLKKILIYRKQYNFKNNGKDPLKTFILFNKYILAADGHVYAFEGNADSEEIVREVSEDEEISLDHEMHIPNEEDVCSVCGKTFKLDDIKEGIICNDNKMNKAHCSCYRDYKIAVELSKASEIIDAVYEDIPASDIRTEWDEEKGRERIWYIYNTNQGNISISFNSKVIIIKWLENFKPFNMSIFDDEDVTKSKREIHAWSKEFAIKYLSMAKRA